MKKIIITLLLVLAVVFSVSALSTNRIPGTNETFYWPEKNIDWDCFSSDGITIYSADYEDPDTLYTAHVQVWSLDIDLDEYIRYSIMEGFIEGSANTAGNAIDSYDGEFLESTWDEDSCSNEYVYNVLGLDVYGGTKARFINDNTLVCFAYEYIEGCGKDVKWMLKSLVL